MEKIRFTSMLSTDDIRTFLNVNGDMRDSTVLEEVIQSSNEIVYYIHWNNQDYVLKCSDFSMKLLKMYDNVEGVVQEVRPDENDWFCFLKHKFGNNYQKHYAKLFHAEDIIKNVPKYISKISFYEFTILIKNILGYRGEYPTTGISIIELESFFQSERRFFIMCPLSRKSFCMRVSDFQVIQPRTYSYIFRLNMEKIFGNEYVKDYQRTFKDILSMNVNIQEYNSVENVQ